MNNTKAVPTPKTTSTIFDCLSPCGIYVVEFEGNWPINKMKEYCEWLEEMVGNNIKFIPSFPKAKIILPKIVEKEN